MLTSNQLLRGQVELFPIAQFFRIMMRFLPRRGDEAVKAWAVRNVRHKEIEACLCPEADLAQLPQCPTTPQPQANRTGKR